MKRILLTALLVVTANTVAAKTLTIKHDKKLPTPHDLITKGTILNKTDIKQSTMGYFFSDTNTNVTCRLATQQSE